MHDRILTAYICWLLSIVSWISSHITDKLIQKVDKNIRELRFDSADIYRKLAKRSLKIAKVINNHAGKMILKLKKGE